jgi:hypothetical protein
MAWTFCRSEPLERGCYKPLPSAVLLQLRQRTKSTASTPSAARVPAHPAPQPAQRARAQARSRARLPSVSLRRPAAGKRAWMRGVVAGRRMADGGRLRGRRRRRR